MVLPFAARLHAAAFVAIGPTAQIGVAAYVAAALTPGDPTARAVQHARSAPGMERWAGLDEEQTVQAFPGMACWAPLARGDDPLVEIEGGTCTSR